MPDTDTDLDPGVDDHAGSSDGSSDGPKDLFHRLASFSSSAAESDTLIPAQIPTVHRTSSLTFGGLAGPVLVLEDASGGCGGKTWEAANVMCDHLIWKHAQTGGDMFRGKTVLELGAGTGIVGLVVGKMCGEEVERVVITDQIPMLELMEANVKLNNLESRLEVKELNWQVLHLLPTVSPSLLTQFPIFLPYRGEPTREMVPYIPDIILASDCVYLEEAFEPLVTTLADLAAPDTTILLSYRKRRKADKRFFNILRKKFEYVEIKDDPNYHVYSRKQLFIYYLTKKEKTQ